MEKKLKEEREAREKAENRVVQIEKQCSMLDVDLKQSQQKLLDSRTGLADKALSGAEDLIFICLLNNCFRNTKIQEVDRVHLRLGQVQ